MQCREPKHRRAREERQSWFGGGPKAKAQLVRLFCSPVTTWEWRAGFPRWQAEHQSFCFYWRLSKRKWAAVTVWTLGLHIRRNGILSSICVQDATFQLSNDYLAFSIQRSIMEEGGLLLPLISKSGQQRDSHLSSQSDKILGECINAYGQHSRNKGQYLSIDYMKGILFSVSYALVWVIYSNPWAMDMMHYMYVIFICIYLIYSSQSRKWVIDGKNDDP